MDVANLCPYVNGNVVYAAQAFYRMLYQDDTTQFDGNCDTAARPALPDAITQTIEQSYKLFPNPNDGSFMLKQNITDATPVAITVKDVLGRDAFTDNVQFEDGIAQLQLKDLPTGVYMLQIKGSNQKVSNFKFVIQK